MMTLHRMRMVKQFKLATRGDAGIHQWQFALLVVLLPLQFVFIPLRNGLHLFPVLFRLGLLRYRFMTGLQR